jgi:hypothetical protein
MQGKEKKLCDGKPLGVVVAVVSRKQRARTDELSQSFLCVCFVVGVGNV